VLRGEAILNNWR
jgi:hypothetical protein